MLRDPFESMELAGRLEDIRRLQPTTPVPVFHGADLKTIEEFCTNGIDGRTPVPRLYPHYIRGDDGRNYMVSRGLFVAPDYETATHFGQAVIRFVTPAANLWPMFPHPRRMQAEDDAARARYPHSFRPSVTDSLLKTVGNGARFNDGRDYERQALFRGSLSPRAINRVYMVHYRADGSYDTQARYGTQNWSGSPADFLKWISEYRNKLGGGRDVRAFLFEPQERLTVDQFYARLDAEFPSAHDMIRQLVQEALRDPPSFEHQIDALAKLPGTHIMHRVFAKRMLRTLLTHYNVPAKPNKQYDPVTYVSGR